MNSITRKEPPNPLYLYPFITSLAKGGYVFGSAGLPVCLFVDNITQKVINGLG